MAVDEVAQREGHETFMEKEIYEQPTAARETVLGRVSQDTGRVFLEEMKLTEAAVPQGRFLSWNELRFHPQVVENGMMQHEDTEHWGHLYHEGVPWQFSKCDPKIGRAHV